MVLVSLMVECFPSAFLGFHEYIYCFIDCVIFLFQNFLCLRALILLYTYVYVTIDAFIQMLTLDVLHVCMQIDEYTHLIASIKAQIKLVRTVYYTSLKNKWCILASHVICLSSDVPRLSTYSLQFHMQVCEGIRELLQLPPETELSPRNTW